MHGGGCRKEVVVLRGVNLASICWLLVFFWLIVGVGWWVLILIDLFFFFLVHWWVLMILPPIGWVMIWLD